MTRALPALVVGFLFGVAGSCTGRPPVPCTQCDGVCVDLKVDSANCGACGQKCAPGSVCSASACVASCPAAQSACNGGCFDLSVDPRHCGACGNACQAGCVDGGCTGQGPSCGVLTQCNGRCVDTSVDPSNCGACGGSCDGGFCRNGTCALCAGGSLRDCNGRCVDTSVDPTNCGSCGTSCGAGFCQASVCRQCSGGSLMDCSGRCVDTSVDPSNCGGCGTTCTTGTCVGSQCVLRCPANLRECAARCVDSQVDPQNCGGCGNECDGGFCVGGACRGLCAAGTAPCNGTCMSTGTDVMNCGGCGVVCPSGPTATASCVGGQCGLVCSSGRFDCDGVAANGCESFAGCVVPISTLPSGLFLNDLPTPQSSVGVLGTFDLSANGQRVAFVTAANGVNPADTNNRLDYFVRDLTTGSTTSLTHHVPGNARANPELAISGNGDVVVFTSPLDLTGQGADGAVFVYSWSASANRYTRLVDSNAHDERDLDVSDDGSSLVFVSSATSLGSVAGQRYRGWLRAADGGFTMLFDPSPTPSWAADAGCSFVGVGHTRISGDGRVASISTNARLTPNDTNTAFDVFTRTTDGGPIQLVSLQLDGGPTTAMNCTQAAASADLSGDGSLVVFYGNEPLTGVGTGLTNSVYARRGSTYLLSSGTMESGWPSADQAGLRFTFNTGNTCFFAEAVGTNVTRTSLSTACVRARIAASGRAAAFLSRDLSPDGGLNLFVQFLP